MSERVGYARCSLDLAELFSVSRATVYRVLERHQKASAPSTSGGQ
ncbi:hypothetical protein [Streptomyces sp. NPDC059166]